MLWPLQLLQLIYIGTFGISYTSAWLLQPHFFAFGFALVIPRRPFPWLGTRWKSVVRFWEKEYDADCLLVPCSWVIYAIRYVESFTRSPQNQFEFVNSDLSNVNMENLLWSAFGWHWCHHVAHWPKWRRWAKCDSEKKWEKSLCFGFGLNTRG